MRRLPRIGVFGLIAAFAVLAAIIPFLGAMTGLLGAARTESDVRASDSLHAAGRQISLRLSRGLTEHWHEHEVLARIAIADGIAGNFPLRLDTAKALSDRLAWMGIAAPDGRVLAATNRLLEGQDVSARPWFRAGLQGAFAGDVHEAQLLARLLPRAASGEPLRLIDFSGPLRRPDGSVIGVLGSHVDWSWVRDLVRTAPSPIGTDALLISREGVVLVGPVGLEGRQLRLRATLSAQQGVIGSGVETWEDGESYLTVAMPIVSNGTSPGFGWSVVVRQSPAVMAATARNLGKAVAIPLAVAAGFVLVAGLLLAQAMSRPLTRLADAAGALAEGRLDQPVPDARTTRELARLADALARLDRLPPHPTAPLRAIKAAAE